MIMKLFWLSFLLALTIGRNEVWQKPETLWYAASVSSPHSPRAHSELGRLYAGQGRIPEAMTQFEASFITGDDSEPYHYRSAALSNMAKIYIDQGNMLPALDLLVRSLTINPDLELASINLAVLYLRTGHPQQAMRVLDSASVLHPDSGAILFNQSEAMRILGRCEEASALLNRAQRVLPDLPFRPCGPVLTPVVR